MWIIKASYPHGGHTVTVEGRSRFPSQQEALSIAESLTAYEKRNSVNTVGFGNYQPTVYIVVEER